MSAPSLPTTPPLPAVRVRRARVTDAEAIRELINRFADRDEMLHRSLGEVFETIRDFYVVEEESGRLLACGALHVVWSHLAEVRSLAVHEELQGRGLGRSIVEACLREAAELGLASVFALTYKPGFFERLGFRIVDKATLPHKVWNECIRCPKFPSCGEIAVVYNLDEPQPPRAVLRVLDGR